MNYDGKIKKDLNIFQQENQNTVDKNQIAPTTPIANPEHLRKDLVTIRLIVGYDFQHGTFDANANDGQGGFINKEVVIIQGGPNQVTPTLVR